MLSLLVRVAIAVDDNHEAPCATCMQASQLALSRNALTGPAFPPAWLEPGALPRLASLLLAGNPGLTGSLPPGLAWPLFQEL